MIAKLETCENPEGASVQPGRIIIIRRYTRKDLKAHPDKLFVFGDNMARRGHAGQAMACRYEPNAIGIPTKWRPGTKATDYFGWGAMAEVKPVIAEEFRTLAAHLAAGGDVVWPADGVGTGLAQLGRYAPNIRKFLDDCVTYLEGLAGEVIGPVRDIPTAGAEQ